MEQRPSSPHEKLSEMAKELRAGQDRKELTVKEFLSWFGAERRGPTVVQHIRDALQEYGLATEPDFEGEHIHGPIQLRLTEDKSEQLSPVETVGDDSTLDPTNRIQKLDAANNPPVTVRPDDAIDKAVTIMLSHDFSQLPVMTTERDVKGAITWAGLGSHLALGRRCKSVQDCMERPEIVWGDEPLFSLIDDIASVGYVLVRAVNNHKITGIVTSSDISLKFKELAEPFVRIDEIENFIRQVIRKKFTLAELQETQDPAEGERIIESASDLTFGEYRRLIEKPENWKKLGLPIDRYTFISKLEEIRVIRNDVMHFDPDGMSTQDREKLRDFCWFLRRLARLRVI